MHNIEHLEIPERPEDSFTHVKAIIGLGVVSLVAFGMQKLGMTHDMDEPMKSITESMSHPVLGYAGAWLGVKVANHKKEYGSNEGIAMIAGGTAVNFFTEHVQSKLMSSAEANYLAINNIPETAKDWGFAMAGVLLFAILDTKKPINKQNL